MGKVGKLGILGCDRKGKLRGKQQKIEGKWENEDPGLLWERKIEGKSRKIEVKVGKLEFLGCDRKEIEVKV